MFDRCISIVTQQLAGRVAAAAGQPVDPEPERDFIICSLDVIAGALSLPLHPVTHHKRMFSGRKPTLQTCRACFVSCEKVFEALEWMSSSIRACTNQPGAEVSSG